MSFSINLARSFITVIAIGIAQFSAHAQEANPLTSYIVDGKAVPAWQASVGNALNYFVPLQNQQAMTKRKNLKVSPAKKLNDGDALNIKWSGKKVKNEWGGNMLNDSFFSVNKHNIDISSVVEQAALAIELKVNRAPTENVSISMRCKYSNKCSGKIAIKAQLKKLPKGKWDYLTLPLNCFDLKNEMDFTEITDILTIATQGKLDIDIANVSLVGLPAGSKGCRK